MGKNHCLIKLSDIIDAQVVKFPNETAQYIKDEKVRQCYIYDYYLKLETKCQNSDGINQLLRKNKKKAMLIKYTKTRSMADESIPLIQNKSLSAKPSPIQNNLKSVPNQESSEGKAESEVTYFRFSHRNHSKVPLSNAQQAAIVNDMYEHIKYFISQIDKQGRRESENSEDSIRNTVRAFDKIHDKILKSEEGKFESKKFEEIANKIMTMPIATFQPFKEDEKSEILSETQAIMIGRLLPSFIRMKEWDRLYSINVDGISLLTFYKNLENHTATIL